MRRWAKRLGAGLILLVALAAASVAGAVWWTVPAAESSATIPGLAGPVAITLDGSGIPWIKAGSEADAAAALGFMHARDRMFQMEMMRRAASGRLSEIAGAATLRLDRFVRTLGLRRRAEAEAAALDPPTRTVLEAYARGVNAAIAARGRFIAPEFLLLGPPEPWTPADTLLWGKTMALYLAGNWRTDVDRARLAARLSPAQMRLLFPDGVERRPEAVSTRLAALVPAFPEPFTLPSEASNEWAVDGARSGTGAPLLAGDPHLGFSFPSIWYLARIDTPGHVLAGATGPGGPFLVIGHNERIAWTFTTTGADTQDVFVETAVGDGQYQTPDGPRPFDVREERIRVRGQPDEVLRVRETRHGPVLSDLDRSAGGRAGPILAVAMASLQVSDTAATGLLALNRAGDLAAAGVASAAITAPVQNLLVADRAGIGLFTTGRVPIRRAGDGSVPEQGADGGHDWTGFAGGADLPRIVAPADGRIVNANEKVDGSGAPAFMGAEWFGDWRAQRIRALLDADPRPDAARFAQMQMDVGSAFASSVLPALRRVRPGDEASRRVLERLAGWDGAMVRDRPEPLLFNAWMRRFFAAVRARLDVGDTPVGQGIDVIGKALGPGGDVLCGGDCAPLLARSLAETAADPADAADWGAPHQAVFAHPLLGRLPWIGSWFTWSIAQAGDDSTIFRGTPVPPGWVSVHGPAFRGVYDLADLDRSLFGLAPGQSGNPWSRDAASTLQRWRDGVPIRLPAAPESASGHIALRTP